MTESASSAGPCNGLHAFSACSAGSYSPALCTGALHELLTAAVDRGFRPGPGRQPTLLNSMEKANRPRVPNAGSFKPGDPRINRNGRPRTGAALAEAIREQLDPKVALDLLAKFAVDENVPVERRLAVLLPWYQAGYTKPEQRHELALEQRNAPQRNWSAVPLEERKALLEKLRGVPELTSGDDEPEAA